jgi:shikimate kinase
MMGSGKTTVGQALAQKMSYRFVDTDKIIEEMQGLTISDIFKLHGESRFREIEVSTIEKLKHLSQTIISTGGGIVLNPLNTIQLKAMGIVIYLRGSIEQLKDNIGERDETRPMLQTYSMETVLKVRASLYEQTAMIVVDIDGKSVDEIVEEIRGEILRFDAI